MEVRRPSGARAALDHISTLRRSEIDGGFAIRPEMGSFSRAFMRSLRTAIMPRRVLSRPSMQRRCRTGKLIGRSSKSGGCRRGVSIHWRIMPSAKLIRYLLIQRGEPAINTIPIKMPFSGVEMISHDAFQNVNGCGINSPVKDMMNGVGSVYTGWRYNFGDYFDPNFSICAVNVLAQRYLGHSVCNEKVTIQHLFALCYDRRVGPDRIS